MTTFSLIKKHPKTTAANTFYIYAIIKPQATADQIGLAAGMALIYLMWVIPIIGSPNEAPFFSTPR